MGNCESDTTNRYENEASDNNSSTFVLDTRCRVITDKFLVVKDLGEGKMGRIACVHKIKATYDRREESPPTTLYAMKSAKVLKRNDLHFVKILRHEIDILKELDHPNIIKAYEVHSSADRNIHVCLEYCSGGNLYSHFPEIVGKRRPFDEEKAAFIIYQLLSALAHMHSRGICHRDIKFENIIVTKGDSRIVKIIDFGAATHFTSGAMCEPIGTVYTMAREVMTGKYTEKADLWSVGVIVYMMLTLTKPFYGKDKKTTAKKVLNGDFKFYSPLWENISSSAHDFVRNLICKDPNQRLSASMALKHSWIIRNYTQKKGLPDKDVIESIRRSFETYYRFNIVKKVALNVMVLYIPTEYIVDIIKVFSRYNTSSSGYLTQAEFRMMLDISTDFFRTLFDAIGIQNNSRGLCFTEFLAAAIGSKKYLVTKDLQWQAFDFLDSECTGFIPVQRFIDIAVQKPATKIEIFRDLKAFLHDGGVDWNGFQRLFEDFT